MPTALKEAIEVLAAAAQAKKEAKLIAEQAAFALLEAPKPTKKLENALKEAEENQRVAENKEREAKATLKKIALSAPESEFASELKEAKEALDSVQEEELEALSNDVELTSEQQAHAAGVYAVQDILESVHTQRELIAQQRTQVVRAPTSVTSIASPLFEQLKGAISGFCSAISNFASKWFYKQEQQKEETREDNSPKL
ncbi:hypothetical protein [Legionella sainthelensi]|uniref:Uncharacterized protein n=1 Tax=Legionella sainthelensi TaxID=28087 RepID=A0A2H5FHI0_9GAMM|nr:hypothetical protein [Legionella sainthelensi]AUH71008.1 hypothetical protein CAB17_02255 [Legionella sainthelensi]